MTPDEEEWRAVPGYEGYYEVSDLGNVRSVDREIVDALGRHRRLRGQALKPFINPQNGRREVALKRGGSLDHRTVYPLVLRAFVGLPPTGFHACHNDGNQRNDRLDNLRWDSRSGNMLDVVRHGRHHNALKSVCKWGHRLEEPNLRAAKAGRGCLACHRASAVAAYARRTRRPAPDHQRLSDDYYQRLMGAAT